MKLAFCGNDCEACPRYVATQSGDPEQLKQLAQTWQELGLRDVTVSPDNLICGGCTVVDSCGCWCRYGIRECAFQRQVTSCGECSDYPCEKVQKAFQMTEAFAKIAKKKCQKEEYEGLRQAFLSKRRNLDKAHEEYQSRKNNRSPNKPLQRTSLSLDVRGGNNHG